MATTSLQERQLSERVEELERRLQAVEAAVTPLPLRARPKASPQAASTAPPPEPVPPAIPLPRWSPDEWAPRPRKPRATSFSDLVGGRVLAWLGGAATLLGIALFLVLAITRGWIGIEARVIIAGAASSLLMAAGAWLHARRGRTEASVVLVGVATAGLFATLLVAANVYGLISPLLGLLGSMLVGGLATVLAIRWAGQAIAILGLLGALVSPLLVGAPFDALTICILAIAATSATWVTVRQRWHWLGLAALLVCVPQWGRFVLEGQPLVLALAALAWFGLLGLAGAMTWRRDDSTDRLTASAAGLLTLNGLAVAVIGATALRSVADGHGSELWLAGLALIYGAAGALRVPGVMLSTPARRLALVVALILADVAFGLAFTGIVLPIGWGAVAVGFAALTRRGLGSQSDRRLTQLGLGVHVALTLVQAAVEAPPTTLGALQLMPLVSVAVLAASCLASAHLAGARAHQLGGALNALGLTAIAYLTAQALTGPALVGAWALEALALVGVSARTEDEQARWAAVGFLALAGLHAFILEAPPTALITGASSLSDAGIALGTIALTMAVAARAFKPARKWLLAGTGITLLYLGSTAIITVFQPTSGADAGLLDLSARQQGQVLLSGCWSLVGVGALIVGLRKNQPWVRNAALALLLGTAAKVFFYDLSTLTSLYRVVSFVALGLLLLAGAFAYQRLRPPPVPDMRSVHPSQR